MVEEPRGRLGADDIMPERQEGHLLKKRKWPLKGWHKVGWQGMGGATCGRLLDSPGIPVWKGEENCVCLFSPYTPPLILRAAGPVPPGQRYFVLDDGILHYATTRQDVSQILGLGCGGSLSQDVLSSGGSLGLAKAGYESHSVPPFSNLSQVTVGFLQP